MARVVHCLMLCGLASCAELVEEGLSFGGGSIRVDKSNGTRIIADSYQLEFATSGIMMPVQLTYEGTALIDADDRSTDVRTEHGVGIALYPAFTAVAPGYDGAVAGDKFSRVVSSIVTDLEGPAVARARVSWEIDFECQGARHAHGESVFTTFPSGRIIRRDEKVVAADEGVAEPPETAQQTCGHGEVNNDGAAGYGPFFLTSYWVFSAGSVDNVTADDQLISAGMSEGNQTACAKWVDRTVAVEWPGSKTRIAVNEVNSFIFDFENGATTIDSSERSAVTRLQLSRAPLCSEAIAELATPPLTIGEAIVLPDVDTIFVDEAVHTTSFTIESRDRVMPGGFAVSVDIAGADHLSITRSLGTEDDGWYIAQLVTGGEPGTDRVILVFRDPLPSDETITITPL